MEWRWHHFRKVRLLFCVECGGCETEAPAYPADTSDLVAAIDSRVPALCPRCFELDEKIRAVQELPHERVARALQRSPIETGCPNWSKEPWPK